MLRVENAARLVPIDDVLDRPPAIQRPGSRGCSRSWLGSSPQTARAMPRSTGSTGSPPAAAPHFLSTRNALQINQLRHLIEPRQEIHPSHGLLRRIDQRLRQVHIALRCGIAGGVNQPPENRLAGPASRPGANSSIVLPGLITGSVACASLPSCSTTHSRQGRWPFRA